MTSLKHIAIVMDGNRRWASQHHLPKIAGHRKGMETAQKIAKLARQQDIKILSLFAFGKENWQRPKTEVNHLMNLLSQSLKKQVKKLHEQNIRLRFIGNINQLDDKLKKQIIKAEQLTKNNSRQTIVLAINYSGQWDIANAAYDFAKDLINTHELASKGRIEQNFSRYLSLADLPPVDLLIRTSGELRISNFFLWQIAHAELYFTKTLWPDFDEQEFNCALAEFAKRKRRFGQ